MVVVTSSFQTTTTGAAPLPQAPVSSTLSLLEHVNFNIPNHEYSLDFYLDVLGFGLDPRVAVNLMPDSAAQFGREGLIWVSCGPNQIHLPRCCRDEDETAQRLYGHIGLRYASLQGLQTRLANAPHTSGPNFDEPCWEWYNLVYTEEEEDETAHGVPSEIHIQDRYGNVFHCKPGVTKQTRYQQPVVQQSDVDTFGDVALRYGVGETNTSECLGIDYLEFECQVHTAAKIANFYEVIFNATTTTVVVPPPSILAGTKTEEEPPTTVAYISIGNIDPTTHEAEQYLIFRETCDHVPPTDGHHIALYLGSTQHETDEHDFARAFHQAQHRGLLSTNWRDTVAVFEWDTAQAECQFRIHDIVDVDTGDLLFQLEHELRSIHHPTWPG